MVQSSVHTGVIKQRPATETTGTEAPLKKRPASQSSSLNVVPGAGETLIKLTLTTVGHVNLPKELDVLAGTTVSEAVIQIAELFGTDVNKIKVSDRKVKMRCSIKGWAMGVPWLADDATHIFEEHDVLVRPWQIGG